MLGIRSEIEACLCLSHSSIYDVDNPLVVVCDQVNLGGEEI